MLSSLPMFVWMGDILFRTKLSEDLFSGLAPIMGRMPGGLLHTNVMGCTIFGSVSGSSAATLSTVAQMTVPELKKRNYPDSMVIGTLAGPATLGLMIPPSIMMVVYGVMTNESIAAINIAGIIPGFVLAAMFTAYVMMLAANRKRLQSALKSRRRRGARKCRPLGCSCRSICSPFVVLGFDVRRHRHCNRGGRNGRGRVRWCLPGGRAR